jgi:SAM-dependent methyltransferase
MNDDAVLWDLEALADARRLGDWMFDQFKPYAHGKVAEIGAGIGTFSDRLLDAGVSELLLIDPEPPCARRLSEKYGSVPNVSVADDGLPDSPLLAAHAGTVDHVVCQNVLEHIPEDSAAVAAMAAALKPGGVLSILVPAHPWLYGPLDTKYEHARRYTRERLAWLAGRADLDVLEIKRFNALGILGWWTKNTFSSSDPELDPRSLKAYEALVRAWRPVEDRIKLPVGLSLILHARKP